MQPHSVAVEVEIRPARLDDADAVADLYLAAFRATYDFRLAHGDDEVRAWLRGAIDDGTSWVATVPGDGAAHVAAASVVGFLRVVGHELDQLYVRPGWWGRGIGSRLVDHAKRLRPDGLALWTFQVNDRARRFYGHHGFTVVTMTDGAHNEERQPDIRYAWRPTLDALGSWDAVYAGSPPWDIGRPQSVFADLAAAGSLEGRVLDVGCGTGEHTLMAAALGLDATGVDIAPSALAAARRKAAERGLTARFIEWDATRLPILGERWRTILDCGVFHVFDDGARARYVASLAAVLEPGGRYHMLVFSDRQGGSLGPRRISQSEIRASFTDGWSIRSIEPAILETTSGFHAGAGVGADSRPGAPSGAAGGPARAADGPPWVSGGPVGAQAWLASIERR